MSLKYFQDKEAGSVPIKKLELVRIVSEKYPHWSTCMLVDAEWSGTEILQRFGKHLLEDLGFNTDDIEVQEGSFYVKGRVDFCQEDAYTLGLVIGDIL